MMARMEQSGQSGEVVQIHHAFKACASDIITQYAFGECLNFIDEPDYGRWYFQATDWFFLLTHVFGLVPGLVHYAQNIPKWSLEIFAPFLKPLRDRQDVCIPDAKLSIFSSVNFVGPSANTKSLIVLDWQGPRDQRVPGPRRGKEYHLRGHIKQLATTQGEDRYKVGE